MAATPESRAKTTILNAMKGACARTGAMLYYESHGGAEFSTPTLDITGTIKFPENVWGVPFAIEVKRFDGKGKLTGRQEKTIRTMRFGGIAAVVIASDADLAIFIHWILSRCPSLPSIETI